MAPCQAAQPARLIPKEPGSCYILRMEITVKIPEELAAQARARGLKLEVYVQEILDDRRRGKEYLSRAPRRRSAPGLIRSRSSPTRFPRYLKSSRASGFTRIIIRWRSPRVWSTRTSYCESQDAPIPSTRLWTLLLLGSPGKGRHFITPQNIAELWNAIRGQSSAMVRVAPSRMPTSSCKQ